MWFLPLFCGGAYYAWTRRHEFVHDGAAERAAQASLRSKQFRDESTAQGLTRR